MNKYAHPVNLILLYKPDYILLDIKSRMLFPTSYQQRLYSSSRGQSLQVLQTLVYTSHGITSYPYLYMDLRLSQRVASSMVYRYISSLDFIYQSYSTLTVSYQIIITNNPHGFAKSIFRQFSYLRLHQLRILLYLLYNQIHQNSFYILYLVLFL